MRTVRVQQFGEARKERVTIAVAKLMLVARQKTLFRQELSFL